MTAGGLASNQPRGAGWRDGGEDVARPGFPSQGGRARAEPPGVWSGGTTRLEGATGGGLRGSARHHLHRPGRAGEGGGGVVVSRDPAPSRLGQKQKWESRRGAAGRGGVGAPGTASPSAAAAGGSSPPLRR